MASAEALVEAAWARPGTELIASAILLNHERTMTRVSTQHRPGARELEELAGSGELRPGSVSVLVCLPAGAPARS